MSLYTKFASVGGATFLSRILGFVREALMAATLGAGPVADAFFAAFRLPNFFRRFFAEGAFNSAFVPMFGEKLEKSGRKSAEEFASSILIFLVLILLFITLLAEIFMGSIIRGVIAPSFDTSSNKVDLTVLLARIMFPYIGFVSLMAMMAAILNTFQRYFLAALAPVLLNVVLVAVLLIAIWSDFDSTTIGFALGGGVVIGGVAQLVLVVWAVRREKFRFILMRPKITPEIKTFLILAAPTALANGIVQVNLLVGQAIASAQNGAISLLQYADRLYQLPLGVIGIAIGVVLLPELTRALAKGNMEESARLTDRSLEFALLLVLPSSIGLYILAEPITALLYERGAFTRDTTLAVAYALKAFAFGLPAFMLIKIFTPVFFARKDTKTPMWLAGINALINIIGSLWLFQFYGHVGIAIATSFAAWFNALALIGVLKWRQFYWPSKASFQRILLICLAGTFMGAACWVLNAVVGETLLNAPLFIRGVLIIPSIGMLALSYFIILHVSGIFPIAVIKSRLKRSASGSC